MKPRRLATEPVGVIARTAQLRRFLFLRIDPRLREGESGDRCRARALSAHDQRRAEYGKSEKKGARHCEKRLSRQLRNIK